MSYTRRPSQVARDGWEVVLFCVVIVFILPYFVACDMKDWCMDRWRRPWRVEMKYGDMPWKSFTGYETLDSAVKEAAFRCKESRRLRNNYVWRIRYYRHRTFIMADIL